MRAVSNDIKKNTDRVQYYILESIQTMLDYVEDTFEPVMLPASSGKKIESLVGFLGVFL